MTKVITNNGIEIDLKYFELEKFCANEIKNKYLTEDFKEFQKNYNYFNAYFDYIFNKKKYILYEPLLISNTYLFNNNKYYYIIKDEKENIDADLFDFSLMNDACVYIVKNPYEINSGFFILEDGTIITNYFVERHLKSAKLILNNYLIRSYIVYKEYLKFIKNNKNNYEYYIIDFLIENIGIIKGNKQGNNIDLIINSNKITQNQLDSIKLIKKYFFTKIEDYNNFDNNKLIYKNK